MFEDKTVDPRECTYRLLASSKLRKQIERTIRAKRTEFGLIKPKSNSNSASHNLMNRSKQKCNKNNNEDESITDTDAGNTDYFKKMHQKLIISKMDEIEEILNRSDEDQKQTFTYDNLTRLHKLLQSLDDSETMDLAKEYFYVFLESNFRVKSYPEKRSNPALDERLRKLKFKAANNDYNSMISNVAQYAVKKGFSVGHEFQNIRSTLLATINALMVIGATFVFFYFVIGYARPDYDIGKIVLYSFSASMIVALAEIYFLIRII